MNQNLRKATETKDGSSSEAHYHNVIAKSENAHSATSVYELNYGRFEMWMRRREQFYRAVFSIISRKLSSEAHFHHAIAKGVLKKKCVECHQCIRLKLRAFSNLDTPP